MKEAAAATAATARARTPTSKECVAEVAAMMAPMAARARTPSPSTFKPPAPGEKRTVACTLPKLWKEDPRLADYQRTLEDAMHRIHDWGNLFDLQPEVLNKCFEVTAEANLQHSDATAIWAPVPDIMQAMAATVEAMGDEVFATWVEAGDREAGDWTFRQTWEAAGAVAWALVKEWGVKPGDRVILCYNFSFEYFPAFLGCLRAGAIACPVYPIDPSKMEIALTKFKHVVEDTGAKVVLTDKLINRVRIGCSVFYGHLMPKDVDWRVTDHLVQQARGGGGGWLGSSQRKSYDHEGRKPSDVAFLQYTSGSTGDPKGVMITFANLGANVGLISGAQQHAFNYGFLLPLTYESEDTAWFSRSRSVSWLPMYHDMGLVYGVVTPFFMGARMHYMSPITFLKDPCSWIRLLAKTASTWAAGPDFAYRLCAKKWDAQKWPPSQYSLTYMIYMHTGAEPIRKATMDDFNRVFHPYHLHARALSPCYGLAESVVCVSWYDPVANPPDVLYSPQPQGNQGQGDKTNTKNGAGYVCVAADFRVDLRIVDPETCEEMEDGECGELWVSGPSVAAGYWNRPEISEKTFRAVISKGKEGRPWAKYGSGKYLRTGDMAFLVNNRVYYSGRIKDMIIVRGQNFYAQDIEFPAQDAWSAIRGGCIAAFSSDVDGLEEEQLEVVFELQPGRYGKEELEAKFLCVTEAIKKRTGLEVYRMVAVKDRTIPKTTSGKIRRKATKEALRLGTLWVLHDSMGLLPPGKGKGAGALISPTTPSSNGSSRSELSRSGSSSYLAGIGESIGGVLGSLYDFISDPLSVYAGAPDAEIVAGPLSAGRGREPRAIEELHAEGGEEDGMGGNGGGNGPRVMVGQSPRYHQQDKYPHVAHDWSNIDLDGQPPKPSSSTSYHSPLGLRALASKSNPNINGGGLGYFDSGFSIGTPPPSSSKERGEPYESAFSLPRANGHHGSSFALHSSSGGGVGAPPPAFATVDTSTSGSGSSAGTATNTSLTEEQQLHGGQAAVALAPEEQAGVMLSQEELGRLSWRHREAAIVEMILAVCRSVGVTKEGISGDTDMISLGLSSVKAAQLIGEIEGKFAGPKKDGGQQGGQGGPSLSEVILYECATIQDVAQLINRTFFASAGADADGSSGNPLVRAGRGLVAGVRWAAVVAGQLLALAYTGALLAVSFLLPLQLCTSLLLLGDGSSSSSMARLVGALLVLPPAYLLAVFLLMALATLTKWAVIGRYQEGTYPVGGLYYLRWLLVDNLLRFVGKNVVAPMRGTALHTLWLQSLGLRGCPPGGCVVRTEDVSEVDLLSLGAGVTVGEGAKLRGAVVEGGHLLLRRVVVEAHATIGAGCLVLPGAVVKEGAVLAPASVLSGRAPSVEAYTLWEGSPAKFVRRIAASSAPQLVVEEQEGRTAAAAAVAAAGKAVDSAVAGALVPCAAMVGAGFCLVLASLPALAAMGAMILATGGAPTSSFRDMAEHYAWAAFIAPLVAVVGPLAVPFFAVLGGASVLESGTTLLDVALGIAARYYVIGAAVGVGVAFAIFGLGVVLAAAIVQRLCGAVQLLLAPKPTETLPLTTTSNGAVAPALVVARWVASFNEVLQAQLHARFPVLLGGTKAYCLYLNALGGQVHVDAYVASEAGIQDPSGLSVGEGAFVHPNATLLTPPDSSVAPSGGVEGGRMTVVGQGAIVGALAVVGAGATVEAASTLAPLSQIGAGQRVYTGTNKCGYTTLLRLPHPEAESTGRSPRWLRWAFAAFTWLYALGGGPVLCVAALYLASYPPFLLLQLAVAGLTTTTDAATTSAPIWLSGLLMAALFPVFVLALLASAVAIKRLTVPAYLPSGSSHHHPLGASLFYYRHLLVQVYTRLVDRTAACALRGTPLYNLYLRLLGVRVGHAAVVLTGDVEGHDLLALGDQTVLNRDVQLSALKLNPSSTAALQLELSPVTVGHECTLGDGTVAMASADVKDLSLTAGGTLLTPEIMLGRRVMVEGNLPYRVTRSSAAPGLNLVTPSQPFNAPMELLRPDIDLDHDCAFRSHLANAAPPPPSYRGGGVALVTGANGFVGRHLVQELLDRTPLIVVCLVRGRPGQPAHERMFQALGGRGRALKTPEHERRLRVVDGDVSKPKLGLRAEAYDVLAAEVTMVFHCATVLGFAAPYANLRLANVVGTKRALEFAAAKRLKRFNHVSSILATSLDMANPRGRITEVAPLGDATVFPVIGASEWTHGYGLSKWAQEVLVQQAQRAGLPATVCRLGEVGPHSRTGFMEEGVLVDLFHDTIASGLVPHALGTINVTPVDYCARGILAVGLAEWGLGRTYHLMDPRFECGADTVVALLQDLGYPVQTTDFLSWRRRMKRDDVRKSWFIAGVLSGEQPLVGQNFDCADGGALLRRQEPEPGGMDGAVLLRRFAQYAKLRNDRAAGSVAVRVGGV